MRDIGLHDDHRTPRQRCLAVLARATCAEIEAIVEKQGGVPAHTVLKRAEVGAVMIEGRAGGTGARFNLGEATVARCIVRLADGTIGVSYALGSDRRKAHLSALLDALLQTRTCDQSLPEAIGRLARHQGSTRDLASRKAATTKVQFFTLVRGDG